MVFVVFCSVPLFNIFSRHINSFILPPYLRFTARNRHNLLVTRIRSIFDVLGKYNTSSRVINILVYVPNLRILRYPY